MPPSAANDFKELVRSRTDLVELVGENVTLRSQRGGSDYVGLCPFHEDHNPSFHVYPERQSYRCWVCQEGGDCFSWVMKLDAVDFREALEMLAQRANLEVPKGSRSSGAGNRIEKKQLFEILAWAETEFHRCLLSSPAGNRGRDYFSERGFSDETIGKFRLGYHPDAWEWLLTRARPRFSAEQLYAARLVRERKDGTGYHDDLIGRVMFPIRDERGRPVAFGGRVLPDGRQPDAPKYLNSAESVIFTKSRLLYGLDVARDAIRRSETAVVVEGYTDCIMAQQFGLRNVIGTLGTALTESHVSGLKRFARKVVLVFDGDDAGQMAAERSLTKFLAQKVDLRILTLPAGMDPADFLLEYGAEAFQERADRAVEAWEFKLRSCIDRYGLQGIDDRQRVLDDVLDLLRQAPQLAGTDRENLILSKLAERVAVSERSVRQRLNELRRKRSQQAIAGPPQKQMNSSGVDDASRPAGLLEQKPTKDDLTECELLEIVFSDPQTVDEIRAEVAPDDFRNEQRGSLLQLCFDLAEEGIVPSFEKVMARLEDPELKRLAVWIDERAREKQIKEKLREDDSIPGGAGPPLFLKQTLHNLKWRRQQQAHELSKGELARLSGSSGEDEHVRQEQLRLLSQAQKFHENRTAKK